MEEVYDAAKAADIYGKYCDGFQKDLKQWLEKGVTLSGGQKQKSFYFQSIRIQEIPEL